MNIFNSINSYSSSIFNTGTLGKLPSNIIKLFNRGFLAGFLEAIDKVSD